MAKKVLRIFAIIVISIILLNILLFLTFSIPQVQKKAAEIALNKFGNIIGTNTQLEGLRIRMLNSVELKGLYVEDQQEDTLLYTKSLSVRIRALDLLRDKITAHRVVLEDFNANIHRETPEEPFNFQFILDSLVVEKDSTIEVDKKTWKISAEDVILVNGNLSYNVLSEPHTPGQFNSNHIEVEDFNFRATASFVSIEDMSAEIKLLSFNEKNSGIILSKLEVDVVGKDSLFKSRRLNLELNQTDLQLRDASYHLGTQEFALRLVSDQVDPKDIGIFYAPLNDLSKMLSFNLEAEGNLPEASLTRFEFDYGNDTKLDITGMISDYSNFDNSNLRADVNKLQTTQQDLETIIKVFAPLYESPPQLLAIGDMDLKLTAFGKLNQFRYNGNIITDQGDVALNGIGRIRNSFANLSFEGPVEVNNFQVANIIGEGAGVGNTTMRSDVKVVIPRGGEISITADGNIESIQYKEFLYNDIRFDGQYQGTNVVANINMNSPTNKFNLFGDITFGNQLGFIVKGDVEQLDLRPFLMMDNWSAPILTTSIEADMSGKTIDDITGTLVIDNTSIVDSNFIYNPGPIYLQALADEGEGKKIQMMSSFMEAEITGDYYFTTIANEFKQQLQPHLPSLIQLSGSESTGNYVSANTSDDGSNLYANSGKNNFSFNISLSNTEDFSYTFALPFYNVEEATISGSVDMVNQEGLVIDGYIPRLMFGNNDIRETNIDLNSGESGVNLDVNSYLVQSNGYINAILNTAVANDSVINRIGFDVEKSNNKSDGSLLISLGFNRNVLDELATNITVHSTTIDFNGKNIDINEASIVYNKDRISVDNFGISEDQMLLLGIDGIASKSEADNIRIYFNNTELSNILTAFNVSNIHGSINGEIFIRQALETPMIRTEALRIEDIAVHTDTIGTLQIEGNWDQLYSGLSLNANLMNNGERRFNIEGFVPTGDDSPSPMDVNIVMEDFELYALQPLTANALSELSGRLNSNINISGKLSEPITEGWLGIDEGKIKVAFTNVTYFLSDTIDIGRDNVGLEDLVIRDQNGHTANLSLKLTHTNFGRLVYTAGITLNDFMLLNNKDRTDMMVYGDMRLSGKLNLTGSPNGIYGDADLTTQSASELTFVLPQTAKATEYSGVIYINTEQADSLEFLRRRDEPIDRTSNRPTTAMPIVMRATLNLTPLLEASVVLDPTTGNALEVSGNGEINVNYNSKSTPPVLLYGDYVINSGKFHYNLQSLRTIDFSIREGSRLTMEGDPLNTQFNITAYLPVRADLAALSPTFTTELVNTRVPVNALLQIRGDLEAMDLQYDIELPESSNDIQQRVNSFISDEETKILQFAYLATTGSFIPSEGSPDLNFGSSVFSKFAANTLSRGLDALFANALNDNWSVSTNLESVDGTFDNVRMGVDVSTRLLNNRLRITTNLSYGDNSMMATEQAFMGEFELEYDLNSWLMLRAYNRANDRFYRRNPTTQGVGVVVTREAQSIKDLLRFRFVRPRDEDE